jgi:hypothetical protein
MSTIDDVNGDLFSWGQTIDIVGSIANNAFIGGSSTSIDGIVGSDAFMAGATSTVNGEVMQNLYIFAGQAFINENAVIHGNLLCFCGQLRIAGTVRGKVLGSGGSTEISGEVGSLKLEVGDFRLLPSAVVHGDVDYEGNMEADIHESAVVGGEVRWNRKPTDEEEEDADDESASSAFSVWNILSNLWWYLANLTVGVAALVFGGRAARAPVARLRDRAAVGLGFGFVVAVVVPVACLIAALLLVTLPLGVIVLHFYLLMIFMARLVTAHYLGDWLLRKFGKAEPSEYLALAGGLGVFFVATEIPYVGFLIWLTALFFGVGGIFLAAQTATASATPSS